ncbi:MAG: hypothetical protein CBC02_001315 [Flavobacteriaceae bacterium TMED42]|nr:MAG: hypothetical protein CBC02_001315 [Flavobacteriaceae bacterium TMED42]
MAYTNSKRAKGQQKDRPLHQDRRNKAFSNRVQKSKKVTARRNRDSRRKNESYNHVAYTNYTRQSTSKG